MDPYKEVDALTEQEAKAALKKAYKRVDEAQVVILQVQMKLQAVEKALEKWTKEAKP